MELTFGESAIGTMLEVFGLDTDDEGYVTKDGERLVDGYGAEIEEDEVGGIIPLKNHGFSVNDEGVVVDHQKNPVSFIPEGDVGDEYDAIVPFITDDGRQAGLVRDSFPAVSDYVSASIAEDNNDQKTL